MSASRPFSLLLLVALAVATASLGCSDDPPGSDPGTGGSGAMGGTGGTGGTGGSQGKACKSASDCRGGVCDPATGTCSEAPIACVGFDDCGAAARCEEGICVPNDTGGSCTEDAHCPVRERCIGGYCGCAGGEFAAEAVEPNVLIVLDKSGSMRDAVGGASKWNIALQAVEGLLAEYGERVRFGLVLYPDGNRCAAGRVHVDVGAGTEVDILDVLANFNPDGSTPTGATMEAVRTYAGLQDASRQNYVLLLTDGDERCNGNGEAAVAALRGQEPEVKTFVVGFGGGVDARELEAMAIAGGTELPGATKYYQADDAASLEAAFADIGGAVLSCSYEVQDAGLSLTAKDIHVYFDGEAVDHDPGHGGGWDYVASSGRITFFGEACSKLRAGEVTDLVIVHGCPIVID